MKGVRNDLVVNSEKKGREDTETDFNQDLMEEIPHTFDSFNFTNSILENDNNLLKLGLPNQVKKHKELRSYLQKIALNVCTVIKEKKVFFLYSFIGYFFKYLFT